MATSNPTYGALLDLLADDMSSAERRTATVGLIRRHAREEIAEAAQKRAEAARQQAEARRDADPAEEMEDISDEADSEDVALVLVVVGAEMLCDLLAAIEAP